MYDAQDDDPVLKPRVSSVADVRRADARRPRARRRSYLRKSYRTIVRSQFVLVAVEREFFACRKGCRGCSFFFRLTVSWRAGRIKLGPGESVACIICKGASINFNDFS